MTACFDAWAVLAWLDGDQPAQDQVDERLRAGRPLMSWVNVVEVCYRVERDHGRPASEDVVDRLRRGIELELPQTGRMLESARLKARHHISLADCFAIATAAAHRLPLLTGNPEIVNAADLPCAVEDLRGP